MAAMSADKEKLNQLLLKVNELVFSINKISEELRTVSASLKSLAVGQITQPVVQPTATSAPAQSPQPTSTKDRTIDEVRMSFPEEIENLLVFEDKGDFFMVKPKQFLKENFVKVASAVRGMGGEYISAGKDSHFRVPKKKA
jgi:hypothetical protein